METGPHLGFAGGAGFAVGLGVWSVARSANGPLAAVGAVAAAAAIVVSWHVGQFGAWRDLDISFAAVDAGLAAALWFGLVVGGGAAHPEVWLPAHWLTWMAATLALFAGGWVFLAGGWALIAVARRGRR